VSSELKLGSDRPVGGGVQQPAERVFVRQATGLVRAMSGTQTMIYNVLISGVLPIGALGFLWIPYALPGANIWLGAILTGVLGSFMIGAYALLGSAMPRSGGDYVFQSRIIGPAFAVPLIASGYVIWLAFWLAYSGWSLATMFVSPTAAMLGSALDASWLVDVGTWATKPYAITLISLVAVGGAAAIVMSGIRLYVRVQWALWGMTLATFLTTWVLMLTHSHADFVTAFNAFIADNGGRQDAYAFIVAEGHKAGYAAAGFSLMDTLGVAAVIWSTIAWAMWSVVNAGEVKHASRLRTMAGSTLGAIAITSSLTAITFGLLIHTVGSEFLGSLSFLYFTGGEALATLPAAPFFGVITATVSPNAIVILLLGMGFLATIFQGLVGVGWGGSRIMLAMAFDRMLPEAVTKVSLRRRTPMVAIAIFFLIGVTWIVAYNHTSIAQYTLAVTLMSILVFSGTCLAAILFPYRRPGIYRSSPGAQYTVLGLPLVTVLGAIGLAFNLLMIYFFATNDRLMVNDPGSLALIAGVLAFCVAFYWVRRWQLRRDGFDPNMAFDEIPPE
jgi:APA family basic amino acid/polyamine antiporter